MPAITEIVTILFVVHLFFLMTLSTGQICFKIYISFIEIELSASTLIFFALAQGSWLVHLCAVVFKKIMAIMNTAFTHRISLGMSPFLSNLFFIRMLFIVLDWSGAYMSAIAPQWFVPISKKAKCQFLSLLKNK